MRILIAGCLLLAACRGEPGKPGNEAGPQQATATPVDDGKADCAIGADAPSKSCMSASNRPNRTCRSLPAPGSAASDRASTSAACLSPAAASASTSSA
jgi:hypothetical protein